jgi:hypothetical protein
MSTAEEAWRRRVGVRPVAVARKRTVTATSGGLGKGTTVTVRLPALADNKRSVDSVGSAG